MQSADGGEAEGGLARVVSHGALVMVWGSVPPIKAVLYDRENGPFMQDSGFLVVYSDVPPAVELDEDGDRGTSWVCLHCLIDEHPEVGVALDMARELGEVRPDGDGGWSPLEEP
jgi:hypothetical protein